MQYFFLVRFVEILLHAKRKNVQRIQKLDILPKFACSSVKFSPFFRASNRSFFTFFGILNKTTPGTSPRVSSDPLKSVGAYPDPSLSSAFFSLTAREKDVHAANASLLYHILLPLSIGLFGSPKQASFLHPVKKVRLHTLLDMICSQLSVILIM